MEFNFDKVLKKGVVNEVINNNSKLCIAHILKYVTSFCAVTGCIGYFIYGMIISILSSEILHNCVLIFVSFLFLHLVFRGILHSSLSPNLLERLDEKIDLSENVLRYTFRPADSYDKYSRVAYNLVLKDLWSFTYDPKEYKLVFKGKMCKGETNDRTTARRLIWTHPEETELVIYDYFEPSLYEALRDKGVLTDDLMEDKHGS